MKGRTAIITGASRGIGRAAAVKLASMGADIVINYLGNSQAAEETEKLCIKAGASVLKIKGDVACFDDCMRIAEETVKRFGRIDILVNNAGITRDGLLMRMDEDAFEAVIDTNLKGSFFMTKAVSRQMLKQRYGKIINLASVVGIMGNAGQANYAASKAGVIGMTRSFAREVASKGITVNAVAPGFIATDMTGHDGRSIFVSKEEYPHGQNRDSRRGGGDHSVFGRPSKRICHRSGHMRRRRNVYELRR